MSDEVTWSDYYDEHEGREPRPMLLETIEDMPDGRAVDLGCGAGDDTLALLERGWRVVAIDAEEEAIRRLRARVPQEVAAHLETQRGRMEDVELPPTDLVWASFSLFFCRPDRFADVWSGIRTAVRPGGRFAGQLLGERDTWAADEDSSSFTHAEARSLFDGWTVERFEEEEEDGEACGGQKKHWHVFHVVARNDQAAEGGS
jgi:SAM-dependent methyltransferase